MSTYIEHETALADANVQAPAHPLAAFGFSDSFSDALPGLIAFWSLPLTAFQIWSHGWSTWVSRTSSPDSDDAQLPVPKPAQNTFA